MFLALQPLLGLVVPTDSHWCLCCHNYLLGILCLPQLNFKLSGQCLLSSQALCKEEGNRGTVSSGY